MIDPSPTLDLVIERQIPITPAQAWRAWTEPALLMQWFTPAPWKTVGCEIDLRPGGLFSTVMQSPEGQDFPHAGCYLEIVPEQRLVWTGALKPGWRPVVATPEAPLFTAVITLTPHDGGTLYNIRLRHADEAGCQAHAAMGFHEGWGAALDQMVAVARAA